MCLVLMSTSYSVFNWMHRVMVTRPSDFRIKKIWKISFSRCKLTPAQEEVTPRMTEETRGETEMKASSPNAKSVRTEMVMWKKLLADSRNPETTQAATVTSVLLILHRLWRYKRDLQQQHHKKLETPVRGHKQFQQWRLPPFCCSHCTSHERTHDREKNFQ